MHAVDQVGSGSLLAIIIGLIVLTVVSYLLFRKRR
jgi:LPXTG-motif cell wall-anchored protein